MQTTILLKTDTALRDEAKATANELGVPLTTVINALLKQFVRERKLTLTIESRPTKQKLALWESISSEIDRAGTSTRGFTDADALIKHLKLT